MQGVGPGAQCRRGAGGGVHTSGQIRRWGKDTGPVGLLLWLPLLLLLLLVVGGGRGVRILSAHRKAGPEAPRSLAVGKWGEGEDGGAGPFSPRRRAPLRSLHLHELPGRLGPSARQGVGGGRRGGDKRVEGGEGGRDRWRSGSGSRQEVLDYCVPGPQAALVRGDLQRRRLVMVSVRLQEEQGRGQGCSRHNACPRHPRLSLTMPGLGSTPRGPVLLLLPLLPGSRRPGAGKGRKARRRWLLLVKSLESIRYPLNSAFSKVTSGGRVAGGQPWLSAPGGSGGRGLGSSRTSRGQGGEQGGCWSRVWIWVR